VEPLVAASGEAGWCVCLINRSTARILAGNAAHLWDRGQLDDDVKGQHKQGGWSQARYERSVDVEAERHLQHVAEELRLRWEREPFHTLVLGGPEETVAEFRGMLHGDILPALLDERLSLDVQNSSEEDVRKAIVPLLEKRRVSAEQEALQRLRAAQGSGGRAVTGRENTELALTERRVETLLLSDAFEGGEEARSQAIEAAILQDADVIMFEEPPPETHLREGIGALLRF
jgi:peptide chain release factor subunit 1